MSATVDMAITGSPAELSDVATTSLLTFYARAVESQSDTPILIDAKAVEITQRLNPRLATSPDRMLRSLASGKVSRQLCVHLALRARQYDAYSHQFLALFSGGKHRQYRLRPGYTQLSSG